MYFDNKLFYNFSSSFVKIALNSLFFSCCAASNFSLFTNICASRTYLLVAHFCGGSAASEGALLSTAFFSNSKVCFPAFLETWAKKKWEMDSNFFLAARRSLFSSIRQRFFIDFSMLFLEFLRTFLHYFFSQGVLLSDVGLIGVLGWKNIFPAWIP